MASEENKAAPKTGSERRPKFRRTQKKSSGQRKPRLDSNIQSASSRRRRPSQYNRRKNETVKPQETPVQDKPVEKPDPTWLDAKLECDFVVKGNLASGVVHAMAACELAKKFRFNTIGGSGIGSAAAAMIAAAETGRAIGGSGFAKLQTTLTDLGKAHKGSRLGIFNLITPEPKTGKYYKLLKDSVANIKPHDMDLPLFSVLKTLPGVVGVAAIPGVLTALTAIFAPNLWLTLVWLIAGLCLAGLLPIVAVRQQVVKRLNATLTENSYGFCTGMAKQGSADSLSEWLHRNLNELAGQSVNEPLTFGDLKRRDEEETPINLHLQCTDISINRPIRFPEYGNSSYQSDQVYYFKPEELSRYLPAVVVSAMVKNSRKQRQFKRLKGYFALPEANKLPLAFAVRCSISVPILFSAVPLYRAVRVGGKGRVRWEARRSWFVGGELSGTFDVDAFDSPLPKRPTFAIHVAPIGSDDESKEEQFKGIWVQNLITHNGPTLWREFNDIRGYLRACMYTSKNWHEGVLMETPGYRERIAVAKISQQQTGMFPAIDEKAYKHLLSLGASIGINLSNRFSEDSKRRFAVSWEAHRWIRFRRHMASLEKQLVDFQKGFYEIAEGDRPFETLMMRDKDEAPHAFHWSDIAQRNHALRITTKLLELIDSWEKSPSSFIDKKAPFEESDNYNEHLR
jgi:predicted acylesterase/phospholipase RssA